jgi:flagellar biogenesis protein FliO
MVQIALTPMQGLPALFAVVYLGFIIAVIIYVLWLLGRFVSAHGRIASALEIIARKLRDDGK